MELAGRHVVITGAAGGIGAACAARFAAEGARVVVSDLAGEPLEALARDGELTAVAADVSHPEGVRRLVDEAVRANGPIDLFFSNAGVAGPGGGPEAPDDELSRTWEINVMAHVWAARVLLPDWTSRGDGYLLSTASAAGLLTQVSALGYSMTKHAAVAVAEWLAINYADAGIKVSCLCPQAVRTPMLEQALDDPVGAAPLLAGGVIEPADVAESVVAGLRDERFLILPHPKVAEHMALKGAQPERWLAGMRRIVRQARAAQSPATDR
jgi:NAD(P)-dependent dehydrogenase (short-subunit alcohol dehydrogenase family)